VIGSGLTEGSIVGLLDADADLAEAVAVDDLERAREALLTATIDLPPGPWQVLDPTDAGTDFALVVLDGLLLRQATAGEVSAIELLGPGDVLVPAADEATGGFVGDRVRWAALVETHMAVVDIELLGRMARWPEILALLGTRMAERSSRQAVLQAVCHHPRVEMRLRGLFWHLAERWGRIASAGVVLPLRLTHEALAGLVGAQRPTVSTALKGLADAGEIERRRDGAWVLRPESKERLQRLQRRRAADVKPVLEYLEGGAAEQRTMAESLSRLASAWEQQSANVMLLRQRSAALLAESKGLLGELRRIRSGVAVDGGNGDRGDAAS
jgi:CRP/FNR family transcriptional regulator, cyclic AMP receptor protein